MSAINTIEKFSFVTLQVMASNQQSSSGSSDSSGQMKVALKRQQKMPDQGGVIKQYKKLEYDERLLTNKFGYHALRNVVINDNYTKKVQQTGLLPNISFQYLKSNFIFKLNNGLAVSCFRTCNGSLALFDVRMEDFDVLNNLLYFLMDKLHIDKVKNTPQLCEKNDTLFVRNDRLTQFFDCKCGKIAQLPATSFHGNVAIKVMGLQFHNSATTEGQKTVKLLIHLLQVRVLDNVENVDVNECLFTD